MHFLPQFPLHLNTVALFGLTLLLGLLGGELAKLTRILPRISGYIAVGFLVGPNGFNLATQSLLTEASIFVDIAIGLILFDLGRQLDFNWLRRDHGLVLMSITESFLTFSLVFTILLLFKFSLLSSALGATIAIATSPAIVMMVAHDICSEGPITRRTMILTSLNNLFALLLFTGLLPITHLSYSTPLIVIEHIMYRIFGSLTVGLSMFFITLILSKLTGKNKESQLVLFIGTVGVSIGLTIALHLSTMLTLFTLGVAARNLDLRHYLAEVDFGWLAKVFFILLFVVTGAYLKFQGLWEAMGIVIILLVAKIIAKLVGVQLFYKTSRLTKRQSIALGVTLAPMAELAIGMSNRLITFTPDFSYQLIAIITAIIAILYIIGPITTQIAFMSTGEATPKNI